MATLGWIKSTKHQKVFVANRIKKILANSKSEQWNFEPGKINPADHGTRGLSLTYLKEKWLSAPKFLLENPVPNFQRDQQFTATNVLGAETSNTVIDTNDFSSCNEHMRRTETVMKAVNIFRKQPVTNSYEDARRHLLRQSQHKTFSDSIRYLERGKELDKRDKLLQFTPFLDKDSITRARGRLQHAKIPWSQKHPIILDSKNSITKLIIEQAHNDCRHLGTEFVRAHLQQDFIIIGQRRFLKQLSKTCFICRRGRAQNITPLMADLPSFRFTEAEKQYPFLNVGIDFFGPFYVEHRNRKLEKQYLCLFTCLVTRAVHLKVCQTLDTDSCLLAIIRSVSRRGYPELIISDSGSNFTSAKKMLDLSKISIDNDYIKSQLQQQNITWKMNPPLAPHFGGIWETNSVCQTHFAHNFRQPTIESRNFSDNFFSTVDIIQPNI